MPANPVAYHSCFSPPLPALPLGYKIDIERPLQLVPFDKFKALLKPINICKKCYIHVITNYNIPIVNLTSARITVSSPAAAALGDLTRYVGQVNTAAHPMYNDMFPPMVREGRRLALILGHEARKGQGRRAPRLSYVIKYYAGNNPVLGGPVRVNEARLRTYQGSIEIMNIYWYGEQPHDVNLPFVRSILARLTPFANSAIWNKLPVDECQLLHDLYRKEELHKWRPGMTFKSYQKLEGQA
jgi:hypothetical protein